MNGKFIRLPGWSTGTLLWSVLVLFCADGAVAGEPLLLIDDMRRGADELGLEYSISGLFDAGIREALDSGLPATLLIRWRIMELRDSWRDRNAAGGRGYFRVFYDVLEEAYDVFNERGRLVLHSTAFAEVRRALCEHARLDIPLPADLRGDRLYYVELELRLQLLDSDQIRDLEGWLGGGRDEDGSLLTGVSRFTETVLKKMTGLGGRGARARSATFRVEE